MTKNINIAKEPKMKSPLRYPGGKSRAVKKIMPLLRGKELLSPFIGGASIEIACANNGKLVYGYDCYLPLVNFWRCALETPKDVADIAEKYLPMSKEKFYELQRDIGNMESPVDMAAAFYAVNRCSFSGTTQSGGMSPGHPRFNNSAIDRLKNFACPNLSVQMSDFKDSLAAHPKMFAYLDPPYALGSASVLYGNHGNTHRNFDHVGLAEILSSRGDWVLSYNDCEFVRDTYSSHRIETISFSYGMNKTKISSEVIIFSKD